MLDILSTRHLQRLSERSAAHCLSLFLPTHRAGPDRTEDQTRLKNLLSHARSEFMTLGLRSPEADRLVAPASALLPDEVFWSHVESGLALFLADGDMETYRLPDAVAELMVVADRFHLKPLIPSLATGDTAHILALSQNEVRLMRASRYRIDGIDVDQMPRSLAEALRFDDRERQLQSHGADRVGRGRVSATFHGQGGGKDMREADLGRFVRAIDKALLHLVGDSPSPLVLAGVDHLVATYRRASRHPWIVDRSIEGNPERRSPAELHEQAWPLVDALFDHGRAQARETFERRIRPSTESVAEAVLAALRGRIDALFVPLDVHCWGLVDSEGRTVVEHDDRRPGDRDLLDAAAIGTLTHGGQVFVCPAADVPGEGAVAAVLRY